MHSDLAWEAGTGWEFYSGPSCGQQGPKQAASTTAFQGLPVPEAASEEQSQVSDPDAAVPRENMFAARPDA